MIHEQEFIELKKKEREGIVARDLLDSLKIRGKKLRKAKRKEPEIQKMLQEKLKQDTIYQSYMNGTCMENAKFRRQYDVYVQKIEEEKQREAKKEEMREEWKKWKNSDELKEVYQEVLLDMIDEIVSCAEKALRNEKIIYKKTENFEYFEDIEEEPLDENNFEDFLRNFYSDWIRLSNFLMLEDFCGDEYSYETVNRMLSKSSKLSDLNETLDIYDELFDDLPSDDVPEDIFEEVEKRLSITKVVSLLNENPEYVDIAEKAKEIQKRVIEMEKRKKYLKEEVFRSIPKDITELYPLARMMKRHFILHIGPTNSGKTHDALKALKNANSGVYLAPLRLMAYETYETMNENGILCSMLTGEEKISVQEAKIVSMTIELLNLDKQFNVAVIDEAQMLSDTRRGGAWTNAILGLAAKEIHICMAPEAEKLTCTLIEMCANDTYEIHHYKRKTPLVCDEEIFHFPESVRKNDALIVFSKAKVIACAAELQKKGIKCSVIYGSLPYETRHNEVKKFVNGETDIVVSTDAIGMGMNIPVERIVFLENNKYDGVVRRPLFPAEVKQIAGRAGRFGRYEKGYYNAEFGSFRVREKMEREVLALKQASIDFPTRLLSVKGRLTEIINEWKNIKLSEIFWKQNLNTMWSLAKYCENFTDDKKLVYRLATTPVDDKNDNLISLFQCMARDILTGKKLQLSKYVEHGKWLYVDEDSKIDILEYNYKIYDLLYNIFRKFSDGKELPEITKRKKDISAKISKILAAQALNPKKCKYCGRELKWNYPYSMCQKCHDSRYRPCLYESFCGDFEDDYWN